MKKVYEVPTVVLSSLNVKEDILEGSDVIINTSDLWDEEE